ncbi:MAG: PEP-CTERM sorting domain-containing protein [Gemmatimonas sp.]
MISSVLASAALRRLVSGAAVLGALVTPSFSSAQVTTFETLGYSGACEWGGGSFFTDLDGKTWNNFRPLDLANYTGTGPNQCGMQNTGYSSLLTSQIGNVIGLGFGPAIVHSTNPFVLNSMVAGAGWQNTTSLKLDFYLNTVLQSSQTIVLDVYQTGTSQFTGFYAGATDEIRFTPDYAGGTDVFDSYGRSCVGAGPTCVQTEYESWFVDNMSFSAAAVTVTPEPSSVALIGAGLLAVGLAARRRRA